MVSLSAVVCSASLYKYNGVTKQADIESIKADPGFIESNKMHSINGYSQCNLPDLSFTSGDKVRPGAFRHAPLLSSCCLACVQMPVPAIFCCCP
jgi:hypothetical protein